VEVKSLLPGGGYLINLQGRFQSTIIATVNPDGSIKQECVSSPEALPSELQSPPAESSDLELLPKQEEGGK
jgi:hypothetical protein